MNKPIIKEIRKYKAELIRNAEIAREFHEWINFYILQNKIHVLEWILGERDRR